MGLRKQLTGLSREYMSNPKQQYFKYLLKILNLSRSSNVSKQEVMNYVKEWERNQK